MRRRRFLTVVLSALVLLALTAAVARALINPNFTPNDLMEQSGAIYALKLGKADAKMRLNAEIVEVIFGRKPEAKKVVIDLSVSAQVEWAKSIAKRAGERGDAPVLLFVAKGKREFTEVGGGNFSFGVAILQIDRTWLMLNRGENGGYEMASECSKLKGTWDGDSESLRRAMSYLRKNVDDCVPVATGCDWEEEVAKPGKVAGKVSGVRAVDLGSADGLALHVASPSGDRVYQWSAKAQKFVDATAALGVTARSAACVWADFDADGRLDLASWDGKALTVFAQKQPGKLSAGKAVEGFAPAGGVVGLLAVDAGVKGRPGILVGTARGPVLLVPGDGKFSRKELKAGEDLGRAGPPLAADLDGDGLYDVLQPFEKAGLIWPGKGGADFAAPKKVYICGGWDAEKKEGLGPIRTCTGDWDQDGRLDVFGVGPCCCALWHNRGQFKFVNTFAYSGEMCYTAQPDGVGVSLDDHNCDGLQDMLIVYPKDPPHHYFNRGYKSFGKSLETTFDNNEFTGETGEGAQAGLVEDLNGDGGPDLALVLAGGDVQVWITKVNVDEPPLSVRAVLPPKSPFAGPVTVTAWNDRKMLGAWSVSSGSPGAFFGMKAPGKCRLKWRFPGGKEVEKTLTLEEKPAKLVLR
ncbi:MAG: FG-GAP repeat domain-containing protein [Planctomycetota bacterium]|jgi:hypothetical protein